MLAERVGFLDDTGGVQERLGRNAADIELTPESRRAFDQRHALAEICSSEGRRIAGRARSEDDDIEGKCGRGGSLRGLCEASLGAEGAAVGFTAGGAAAALCASAAGDGVAGLAAGPAARFRTGLLGTRS